MDLQVKKLILIVKIIGKEKINQNCNKYNKCYTIFNVQLKVVNYLICLLVHFD